MKTKLLNLGLVLSSLIGYLEWGQENSSFLFQAEYEVLLKLFTEPSAAMHPFTLIPLLGQLLLLLSVFQKTPNKYLSLGGFIAIALLFAMMLFVGILSMNVKIIVSTLPFFVLGVLVLLNYKQNKRRST